MRRADLGIIPISVTFEGFVYMDYDDDCRIFRARAIAPQVRSKVLSMLLKSPNLFNPAIDGLLGGLDGLP